MSTGVSAIGTSHMLLLYSSDLPASVAHDRLVGATSFQKAVEFSPEACSHRGRLVDALLPARFVDDETGVLQHLQMLRDRRPLTAAPASSPTALVLDQRSRSSAGRISQCRSHSFA